MLAEQSSFHPNHSNGTYAALCNSGMLLFHQTKEACVWKLCGWGKVKIICLIRKYTCNLIKSSSKDGYNKSLLSPLCYCLQMLWVKTHFLFGKITFFSCVVSINSWSITEFCIIVMYYQHTSKSIHCSLPVKTTTRPSHTAPSEPSTRGTVISTRPHQRCWWWFQWALSGQTPWRFVPGLTPGMWFQDAGQRTCGMSRSSAWTLYGEDLARLCLGLTTRYSDSWSGNREKMPMD